VAVQQQHGRPSTALPNQETQTGGFDHRLVKSLEHLTQPIPQQLANRFR